MKYLTQSFKNAIVKDDLEECKKKIFSRQIDSSLETNMSSCHECSPLVKTVRWEYCDTYSKKNTRQNDVGRTQPNPTPHHE